MKKAPTRAARIDPALKASGRGMMAASRARREALGRRLREQHRRRARPRAIAMLRRNTPLCCIATA